MSNEKAITAVKPLIYFREGEVKIYLLVKPLRESEWQLPEFKLNLQEYSQIETLSLIYRLLEEHFAISINEVKSLQVNKESQSAALVIDIEIQEEAVIVLNDKYLDYAWGDKEEAN